jgi:hypothetical protein
MRHTHLPVVRIVPDEPRRDLLRRPALQEPTFHFTAQPGWIANFAGYELPDGTRIWIITEADSSATTILVLEEY